MSFIPEGWTGVYWDVGSFHRATPPILSHILLYHSVGVTSQHIAPSLSGLSEPVFVGVMLRR
jgi:hypothetical protein